MSIPDSAKPAIAFGGVNPIFCVRDLAVSIPYYTKVLGFKIDFEAPGYFVSVSRGRCSLFLCQGDQGHPGGWVWIDGGNVEVVHEEFKASGAKIRNPPTNYAWALEMQVEDPDGNVLRIGSDPRAGEPYGDWLDMAGVRWRLRPDGGYERVESA
jgi:catechol 2,3-dioxygenase-like lactoylglutathione lyase family enzyme